MVAAAVVGAAVVGAVASNAAANKGAKGQSDAANAASQTELAQFYQNREDAQPWREAGTTALGQLSTGTAQGGEFNKDFTLSDFQHDPGYAFRQQEGQRGIEASAAARGGALGGGAARALDRYNQDYASGEFQNAYNRFNNDRTQRFNRLSSLAGTGQTATRDVANQGAQVASQVGENGMQAANARASGYVGSANSINNAAGSLGNWAMQNQFLNKAYPQQTAAPANGSSWTGGWDSGSNSSADVAYG